VAGGGGATIAGQNDAACSDTLLIGSASPTTMGIDTKASWLETDDAP
jgi:hypothetical protein